MASSILQFEGQKSGLTFDPRTKLFLLLTMATFGLGGAGGEAVDVVLPFVLLSPYVLLLLAGKWKWAAFGAAAYVLSDLFMQYVSPHLSGVLAFIALGSCAILNRFLPSILLAAWLMSTTTVSEFTAVMQRMHVSEKITIPLSAMFRFFPTVADEAASIGSAMRMRDIRFGGSNAAKTIEYRMVCMKDGRVAFDIPMEEFALLSGKDLLVFDEPTSGMDFQNMERTAALLASLRGKASVFVVTHDPDLVSRCCTSVIHLQQGKLV